VHFSVFLDHLDDLDRIKLTNLVANATADADIIVDVVDLFTFTSNSTNRAVARANSAASAIFGVDLESDQ